MDFVTTIPVIITSIIASAFFSGMEIAFVSANRLQVELENKQGSYAAPIISHFLKHPKKFIASMLVGNNIALVVYGIFMGDLITQLIFGEVETRASLALLVQTIISTLVILVTAEFLPKAIFNAIPNRMLNVFAFPLALLYGTLYIPAVFITWLSRIFLDKLLKTNTVNERVEFGRVDLDHFIKEATQSIDPEDEVDHEIQIFQNALDFSSVKARDCQVPRNELIAVDIDESVEDLRQKFVDTGLSKILVYKENIDNIIGYVHSYELFKKPEKLKNILRPVSIVPEPMAATEVLEQFIRNKRNMAVVVDEFGGTSGIVTMEDIVEEIFGDIEDEHDKDELTERQLDAFTFEFSGRLEIDYLNENYKLDLPEDETYDTLAGWILHHYEDIPNPGDLISINDQFRIKVMEVSNTRIELVRLRVSE